jgi:glucuronate isomerase
MKPFIHDNFLFDTEEAAELYHGYAKNAPIIDYHCHLPVEQIVNNTQFADLAEAWLGGDHYKWRAMRSNGCPEWLCTGAAPPREKFDAWVATVPFCLRNPLYHWSHLELKRIFDLDLLISPDTADTLWEAGNERLPALTTQALLEQFDVAALCTTDDPADPLRHHEQIAASGLKTRVYPTYRPDKAYAVEDPSAFCAWCERLGSVAGISIQSFDDFLEALEKRHADFHAAGGRLSDHGLEQCYSEPCSQGEASSVFNNARAGIAPDAQGKAQLASFLLREFGRWDAKRGWTKQLHLGAMRNNNTRLFKALGPDTGFDSIGDFPQARNLARYLDDLDSTDELPKVIIYNLNPADNYIMGTMIGNFQDGSVPGKVQLGTGWWFLDQEEAMEWQMNALSNLGLLRRFVGMLTDSRSFLSFPRHEYFRRVLCNLLGRDLKRGVLPGDRELIGAMIRDICFGNARDHFGLSLHSHYTGELKKDPS